MKEKTADDILQALLTHRTIREAATAIDVSERTIYDYLKDAEFKSRYKAARDDLVSGVSNHLRERMHEAVNVIAEIMNDTETRPQVRLTAAKTILELGAQYTEKQSNAERLAEQKQEFDDLWNGTQKL